MGCTRAQCNHWKVISSYSASLTCCREKPPQGSDNKAATYEGPVHLQFCPWHISSLALLLVSHSKRKNGRAELYRLKAVDFFGRKVPVVLQNKNGPCPLLAIANVLLLRKQIHLPVDASEVSQDRLIALVANHLLEANCEETLRGHVSEEYQVNLHRNIEDAIALLPKLTTGVDVNPRFSGIKAFEFTDETAIFDLLDISLVHGWLVDAQDAGSRQAVGEMSYNELVTRLATLLGAATPKHLTSRPTSARALHTPPSGRLPKVPGGFDLRSAASGGSIRGTEACPTPTATPAGSMELPSSLASLKPQPGPSRLRVSGSEASRQTLATLHSAAEAIAEEILTPSPVNQHDARNAGAGPSSSAAEPGHPTPNPSSHSMEDFGPAAAPPGPAGTHPDTSAGASKVAASSSQSGGAPAQPARSAEQKHMDAAEAHLLQDFLEGTSSQLTYPGLEGLHGGLRSNELAVFFRNNHFNTIFHHQGHLHILVTDLGYLQHPDVVWERLDRMDGDTEFLSGTFASYRDKAFAEEVSRAAKLTQAAFADVVPPLANSGGTGHDQDFALALQLQEEERERDRSRLQAQQQQQQQQKAASGRHGQGKPPSTAQQPSAGSSRNVVSADRRCSAVLHWSLLTLSLLKAAHTEHTQSVTKANTDSMSYSTESSGKCAGTRQARHYTMISATAQPAMAVMPFLA
ncbi:hypothetical protein WJX84_010589 [Apatococcus fuscideae]|uniref:MINDY deubiquitinase domain-containing protein n=1 Tax=Apatococcus fuscideae TaxID=2026836 RepID=A0AAW1T669_9CHLO